jgi:HK97 gp10 family phage protein
MAKILNENRLYAKLDKIAGSVRSAVRNVLAREAQQIVDAMKQACPEDTGELKNSIGWTFGYPKKGKLPLGTLRVSKSDLWVTIYAGNTKAYYAMFIEFGTSRNRPQPFFWPTWSRKKRGARTVIFSAARAGIQRAIK